MDFAMDVD